MTKHAQRIEKDARKLLALSLCGFLSAAPPAHGAELKQTTLEAFGRYVRASEGGENIALATGKPFLWVERLPEPQRAEALAKLHRGEVVIEKLEILDGGKHIEIPDGLIHHWIGTVFIPGATLRQTLALEEDYDRHQDEFRPEVIRSKIEQHSGDDFLVYLRLRKHKVLTVILDTEHRVYYDLLSPVRATSRSWTTRIQQVDDAGKPDEHLRPVGEDDGFLWRMNNYWRFEERDGGTYVECQSISLTRDIPAVVAWLVRPFVMSVPRESLDFILSSTRRLLLGRTSEERSPHGPKVPEKKAYP